MNRPQQGQELASMTPERLDQERDRWQLLKQSVEALRNHPLMPELERIGAQAGSLWQRNAMLINMPESGEQIVENWRRMNELYNRASELKARMLGTRMEAVFGADGAQGGQGSVRDSAMDRLNTLFSVDGGTANGSMNAVNRTLSTYLRGLTADPNEVLAGNSRDGHFYGRRRDGQLGVNWRNVDLARQNIDMIARSPMAQMNPDQQRLLQQMRDGIQQVESIDPIGAAMANWRRSVPRRETDYRPIRFLTGIGASLITGYGLYMGNKHGFTWPTALWAGIAAISVNPDLLRNSTYHSLQRMSYLGEPSTLNMLQRGGVSGDRGAAIMEELQELQRTNPAGLNALIRRNQPVTMAQIGALTEGRNTPLVQALSRMENDMQRNAFLHTFVQSRSRDDQQILREFVRSRDRIDPRLDQNRFLFGNNANA
jgi:hypothetical protein